MNIFSRIAGSITGLVTGFFAGFVPGQIYDGMAPMAAGIFYLVTLPVFIVYNTGKGAYIGATEGLTAAVKFPKEQNKAWAYYGEKRSWDSYYIDTAETECLEAERTPLLSDNEVNNFKALLAQGNQNALELKDEFKNYQKAITKTYQPNNDTLEKLKGNTPLLVTMLDGNTHLYRASVLKGKIDQLDVVKQMHTQS